MIVDDVEVFNQELLESFLDKLAIPPNYVVIPLCQCGKTYVAKEMFRYRVLKALIRKIKHTKESLAFQQEIPQTALYLRELVEEYYLVFPPNRPWTDEIDEMAIATRKKLLLDSCGFK